MSEYTKLENIATESKAFVLYSGAVTIEEKKRKKEKIIVISNYNILIFTNDKKQKLESSLYWFDIKNLSLEGDKLNLKFKESDIKIISKDLDTISNIVGELIQRMYSKITVDDIFQTQITSKKFNQTNLGIYSLFSAHLNKQDINLSSSVAQYMMEKLMVTSKNLIIDQREQADKFIEPLVEALNDTEIYGYLKIPNCSSDVYKVFGDCITDTYKLHHIHIVHKATSKFQKFCSSLKEKKAKIFGITLEEAELSQNNFCDLHDTAVQRKFNSLGLVHSVKHSNLTYMYDILLVADFTQRLQYLNLDYTPGLRLDILLPKLENVVVLSLAYCELQVSDVFDDLHSGNFSNLAYINLSGNQCSNDPLSANPEFPPHLKRIDMNDINWTAGTLTSFISTISKQNWRESLTLSVSQIAASDSEWESLEEFFKTYKKSQFNLKQLSFNSNRLSTPFFKFLKKCKQLKHLYINDCVNFDASFSSLLEKSRSLITLYVQNADTDIVPLLPLMRNLVTLDLRNNKIGDNGLTSLFKLIKKSDSLKYVAFDGSNIQTYEKLLYLREKCGNLDRPVFIDWPFDDLRSLKQMNLVNDEKIDSLKLIFSQMAKKEDVWHHLFEVYSLEQDDVFPTYFSKEVENMIDIDANNAVNDKSRHISSSGSDVSYSEDHKSKSRRKKRNRRSSDESDSIDDNQFKRKQKIKVYMEPKWKFPYQSVDTIDVEPLVEELQKKYSMKNLSSKITNEKSTET